MTLEDQMVTKYTRTK